MLDIVRRDNEKLIAEREERENVKEMLRLEDDWRLLTKPVPEPPGTREIGYHLKH